MNQAPALPSDAWLPVIGGGFDDGTGFVTEADQARQLLVFPQGVISAVLCTPGKSKSLKTAVFAALQNNGARNAPVSPVVWGGNFVAMASLPQFMAAGRTRIYRSDSGGSLRLEATAILSFITNFEPFCRGVVALEI